MAETSSTDPQSPPPLRSDTRTIVMATLAVLLFGGLVAAGLLYTLHRGGGGPSACGGIVAVGDAAGIRDQIHDSGGAYYQTLGGRCEYWVAEHDGKLAAVKARLSGRSCAVRYRSKDYTFLCDGEPLRWPALEQWPSEIPTTGPNRNMLVIDFGTN
jgi:hypothetical protein